MTSSILLNIPRRDSGFIAQINELIAIHYSATLVILCGDKARSFPFGSVVRSQTVF
jgi:hypothetical protein